MGVATARAWEVAAMMMVVSCVAACVVGAAAEGSLETDIAALREVARSNPTFNLSWVEADPCHWQGVHCLCDDGLSCDDHSPTRVLKLKLQYSNLSGPIPKELGSLTAVQWLDLSLNQLNGSIPKEFGNLRSVGYLLLAYNQLSGPIPADLGNLNNVTYLTLHSNNLSGTIPAELGNLKRLKRLFLGANQLRGPIPQALKDLDCLQIDLGCITDLTAEEQNFVCTSPVFWLDNECSKGCKLPFPKMFAAILWSVWLVIAVFILSLVMLLSWRLRPPVPVPVAALGDEPRDQPLVRKESPDGKTDGITPMGMCKYAWGLLSWGFIVYDVITNLQSLQAVKGSWAVYVIAVLIVWQHLISGVMLYTQCVRTQSWPLGSGMCTTSIGWSWEWRRCIVDSKGKENITGVGKGIHKVGILHVLLWPLGLVYAVMLDILSLLSCKLGLQLAVGSKPVNLQPYLKSRELTDALFQALPQAIFQTAIVATRVNPKASKIFITRLQLAKSVSSSLGTVICVLAMVLWEAQMERQNVLQRLWNDFTGILPVIWEDDDKDSNKDGGNKSTPGSPTGVETWDLRL